MLTGDQYTSTIYPLWSIPWTINHAARISFLYSYLSPLSFANIQMYSNRNLTKFLSVARLQVTWFISFVVWIHLVTAVVLLYIIPEIWIVVCYLSQLLCEVFFEACLGNTHFFWFLHNVLSCPWQSVSLIYEHTLISPKSGQEK